MACWVFYFLDSIITLLQWSIKGIGAGRNGWMGVGLLPFEALANRLAPTMEIVLEPGETVGWKVDCYPVRIWPTVSLLLFGF